MRPSIASNGWPRCAGAGTSPTTSTSASSRRSCATSRPTHDPPEVAARRSDRERHRRRAHRRLAVLDPGGLMPHAHVTAASAARGRLAAVLAISLVVLVIEVVGALAANSLALLADAGHLLTDVAGVGLALLAIWFAGRPPTLGRTFGYLRLEILAAVANAVLLFGVAAIVVIEAIRRIGNPPEIASGLMLAIALVGLAANAVSLWLLRDAQRTSLNVRGAYLEVLGDFAGSGVVIVAAVVIAVTDWTPADTIASLLIAVLILPRTLALLREAT